MRRSPQRSCIGCRAVRDQRELIRVARTAEGRLVLDRTRRTPGRGGYLCPASECFTRAVRRKSFDRAFRETVSREELAALEASVAEYLAEIGRLEERDAGSPPASQRDEEALPS